MCSPRLEAVVVTYNSASDIRSCLASLRQAAAKVVVVDNNSDDDTVSIISAEFPEVKMVGSRQNLGYGRALNLGIAQTSSGFVLAANADTVFPEGSLEILVDFLKRRPEAGVAGAQLVFPDGSWQRSYGDAPSIYRGAKMLSGLGSLMHAIERLTWRYRRPGRAKKAGYVDGAVMMIRREAFEQIGGFDEDFHFYCEDADLCVRMRRIGWQVVSVPKAVVYHMRGGSSTRVHGFSDALLDSLVKAECLLLRKHYPDWHLGVYRKLCIWHARKMQFIYRMMRVLRPASYVGRATTMTSALRRWERIWSQVVPQQALR